MDGELFEGHNPIAVSSRKGHNGITGMLKHMGCYRTFAPLY